RDWSSDVCSSDLKSNNIKRKKSKKKMKENNKILYICILYKNTKKNIAMTKGRKTIIELGLLGVIVILIFLIYNSIKTNIDFENEKNRKIELVKTKLMNARELQFAYERKHREYCNDWDKLIKFTLERSEERR